jgi:archaeal flagellin FlaB
MSRNNVRKFGKNDAAFTGLEAAIVLIAFVVVAAVFSYVMLGAGFFTSQKSKEVVHTGVDQATSSMEITGDVIGESTTTGQDGKLETVLVTLGSTAGGASIDISKTTVSWKTAAAYDPNIFTYSKSTDGSSGSGTAYWVTEINSNNLLEPNEKVQLTLAIPHAEQIGINSQAVLTISPPIGTPLTVTFTTPATIDSVMSLF